MSRLHSYSQEIFKQGTHTLSFDTVSLKNRSAACGGRCSTIHDRTAESHHHSESAHLCGLAEEARFVLGTLPPPGVFNTTLCGPVFLNAAAQSRPAVHTLSGEVWSVWSLYSDPPNSNTRGSPPKIQKSYTHFWFDFQTQERSLTQRRLHLWPAWYCKVQSGTGVNNCDLTYSCN